MLLPCFPLPEHVGYVPAPGVVQALSLARLPGAGMSQENSGLFLQRFEAIILISRFFSAGNSLKGWKIITLWNRFDFLPGLLPLPGSLKNWGFWRENFITHDWSLNSSRVGSTLECLYRLGGAVEYKCFFLLPWYLLNIWVSIILPFWAAHADKQTLPFAPLVSPCHTAG